MKALQQILGKGLYTTTRWTQQLRGGLYLIFYPREGDSIRLVAARHNTFPSETECMVLRRELTAVLAERNSGSATPNATVGEFKQLPPENGWYAAEVWISFEPIQVEIPIPKETRYE